MTPTMMIDDASIKINDILSASISQARIMPEIGCRINTVDDGG